MTRSRQTADWGSRAGLAKIVPSSVAVGSGTGSASQQVQLLLVVVLLFHLMMCSVQLIETIKYILLT
jgi:hypothetical protein